MGSERKLEALIQAVQKQERFCNVKDLKHLLAAWFKAGSAVELAIST